MHPQKIEIDDPRSLRHAVFAVLRIIAVGQAGIEPMGRSLRIYWASPRLLLQKHDLAPCVEPGRERSRARHARIVIRGVPRLHVCVHVAIAAIETEFALDFGRELFAHPHRPDRFGPPAAPPRGLKGTFPVPIAPDYVVLAPIRIHGGEIHVVVVRSVDVSKIVDHRAGVLLLRLVASAGRLGAGAERIALLFADAPRGLVVGHYHLRHSAPFERAPIRDILLPVDNPVLPPQMRTRHVFPRRRRIGDFRQH